MKNLLSAFLLLLCTALSAHAQTSITLPISAAAVADIGNGPIKVRVIQGNASIFTAQGSGPGSTSGSSTLLTLTGTPAKAPLVGALISGIGITSGTTVAAYNGTTGITLSAAMTVSSGTAISWGAACPASAAGIPSQYIQASVMADYYLLYTQARVCAISPGGPSNTLLVLPVFYESLFVFTGFAAPSVLVGLTPKTGTATTAMRSDGAPALDQTIAPTMTGLWTFQNTVTTSVANVLSGTSAGTQGFNVNSVASGTQSGGGVGFNGNIISTSPDNAVMANGTFYNTLALQDNLTGGSGGRQTLQAMVNQTGATAANSLNRNYVGAFGRASTTSGDRGSATNVGAPSSCSGTGPTYCGGYIGGGFVADAIGAGLYPLAVEGVEINWNVPVVGTHVKYKVGLSLANLPTDADHADTGEAIISMSSAFDGVNTGVAMNGGMMVTDWNGHFPFDSASTAYGSSWAGAKTIKSVFDLVTNAGGGSLACTDYSIRVPGMAADCGSNLTLAPSSAVATVAGYSVLSLDNVTGGLVDFKTGGTIDMRIQAFATQGVITTAATLPLLMNIGNATRAEFFPSGCFFVGATPADCGAYNIHADGSLLAAALDLTTGASAHAKIAQWSDDTTYNAVTLNGFLNGAGMLGFVGKSNTLFYEAPSGGSHTFRINNTDGMVFDGSKLTLPTAAIVATSLTLTAPAPTVAAAQIGYGSTTAAAANCNVAVPTPTGCIVVNIAGTTRYVPFY